MTLKELFDRSCVQYAERIAISFVNGTPMTYSEMGQEVNKTITLLCRMGICKGDRVAILSSNMPNWCITYFAITGMGAIVVPILPDFHSEEVQSILQHSGCKAIFVSQKLLASIAGLQNETLSHVIAIEDFSMLSGELAEKPIASEELPVDSDTASIIYTSGTTGRSKGVMLSHHNITVNAVMCLQVQDVNLNDVLLSILPLSHTYENTIAFILPIMQGASIYYLEKPPTASVLVPALEKVRPTTMLSVPLVIEKIYRNQVQAKFTRTKLLSALYENVVPFRKLVHYLAGIKLKKTFGGRLRFFGVGGAKIDPVVERFLREARFPYAIGYGLTETAPLIAGANPSKTRFQAIGPALEGVEMKIVNPDARTGLGEVVCKGENVMQGYYRDPELTRSVFTDDGFFRTGDLGCFDKHRYLSLKGRLKSMIVGASGENIYPEDIESIINNVRGVLESLVLEKKGKLVAMVHLNMEELEKSYLQARDNAIQYISDKKDEWNKQKEECNKHLEGYLEELKNNVNHRVNRFSQIHSIIVVPDPFEKTPTQKIKRYLY
ncbi:MAG: AMP-binding protein [Tannerella sp.]|jgi:long-chain acyl-CoA synthetase|nr:AMP-binding protein [Tannerella sp.]